MPFYSSWTLASGDLFDFCKDCCSIIVLVSGTLTDRGVLPLFIEPSRAAYSLFRQEN